MKCIDDLFDWILEDIFQILTRKDRLICKEVCKRWNKILMERQIFYNDRHIYINTNKADAASLSVLLDAKWPYKTFTIVENSYNAEILSIFKQIGKSIEQLNYKRYTKNIKNGCLLTKMPFLKYLKMEPDNAAHTFTLINKKEPTFDLHQLERIVLSGSIELDGYYILDQIHTIKRFIPPNCCIFVESNGYSPLGEQNPIDYVCQVIKLVKFKSLEIRESEKDVEKLLEDINCEKLDLFCSSKQPHIYHLLEEFQHKHENLKSIKLKFCESLPPVPINLHTLTYLDLYLVNRAYNNMKPLEQLTNLKGLKLMFKEKKCAFGHELIYLPKVKSFDITLWNFCFACLESIAGSFGNLKKIIFRTKQNLTWLDVSTLITNWKYLKDINIFGTYIEGQVAGMKPREHIQSLAVRINNLTLEKIEEMSKSFPNVEYLRIITINSPNMPFISDIFKAVVPAFSKLTTISFINEPYETEFDSCEKIRVALQSIGFTIVARERLNIQNQIEYDDVDDLQIFTHNNLDLKFDRQNMTTELRPFVEFCLDDRKYNKGFIDWA